jgi:ABC-2 type transport system permease protein
MSLFPLTAPVAMMARLSAGGVPLWQPILAAILLALTDAFVLRAVAGMFRAQALLSGQQFSIKLYYNALLGKA